MNFNYLITLLFISSYEIYHVVSVCPANWHLLLSGNKCIRYFPTKHDFFESQLICQEIFDGNLVIIQSKDQQKQLIRYLYDLLGQSNNPVTWIGARSSNGNLTSVDGTTANFSNFGPFSETTDEVCVKVLALALMGSAGSPGQWGYVPCSVRDSGFVCEVKAEHTDSSDRQSKKSVIIWILLTFFILISGTININEFNKVNVVKDLSERLTLLTELFQSQIQTIQRVSSIYEGKT